MNIDSKQTIAGVPILKIRAFLRQHHQWGMHADDVESSFPGSGQPILNALISEGYVEPSDRPDTYKTTPKGGAFVNASAARPISRKTAERCLKEFLARVEEVRRSPEFLWKVKRVILFGSYLTTNKDKVSDVDLAIDLAPKEKDPDIRMALERANVEKAMRAGRRFSTYVDELFYADHQVRTFLKSRSHALQFTSCDDPVLKIATHKVVYEDPDD